MDKNMEKNYINYFDYLRIVASAGVMLTHISTNYYLEEFNHSYVSTSLFPHIASFLDPLSRFAVPLFMMITGVLIFEKNYSFNLKKSVVRIALPLITWSIIYLIWMKMTTPDKISLTASVKFLFIKHLDYNIHLWYLYILIGIYLTVPCIKKSIESAGKKELQYMLLLWFIFTVVYEFVTRFFTFDLPLEYKPAMPVSFYGYMILGFYSNRFIQVKQSTIILLFIAVTIPLSFNLFNSTLCSFNSEAYDLIGPLLLIQTLLIFLFCKNIKKEPHKFVKKLSKLSFCTYLVHLLFSRITFSIVKTHNILLDIILRLIVVFVISYAFSYLLDKITPKRIKKYIGL
jgi:surface polysaccharide O-acyltransferase-like enzyme